MTFDRAKACSSFPLPALPSHTSPFHLPGHSIPMMRKGQRCCRLKSRTSSGLCPLWASAEGHPAWPCAKNLHGTAGENCMMLMALCPISSVPGGWKGPRHCCHLKAPAHGDFYKIFTRPNGICSLTRKAPKLSCFPKHIS